MTNPSLPTSFTTDRTAAQHLADHEALHTNYNNFKDSVPADFGGGSGSGVVPLVFSQQGTVNVATGTQVFVADRDYQILSVRSYVVTAPTGASLKVQVNVAGSAIFSSGAVPTIAAAAHDSGAQTPDLSTSLLAGQTLTVDVTQVGSSVHGSDLSVTVGLAAQVPATDYRQTGVVTTYTLSNDDVGAFVDCQNTATLSVHVPNGLIQGTTEFYVTSGTVQVVADSNVNIRPSRGSFYALATTGETMALQLIYRSGGTDYYVVLGATS